MINLDNNSLPWEDERPYTGPDPEGQTYRRRYFDRIFPLPWEPDGDGQRIRDRLVYSDPDSFFRDLLMEQEEQR